MATRLTLMNRAAARQMQAAQLEGAILADAITADGTNQRMQVAAGGDLAAPSTFVDGPLLRVDTDEFVYVAAGDATIDATVANVGVPVGAGTVEYFEINAGSYVAVTTTKA